MARFKDLSGERFGRLVAIKPAGQDLKGSYRWECLCDCGETTNVTGYNLGLNTNSCGKCLVLYQTHGDYKTRFYGAWSNMKKRVKNNLYYSNISICKEWNTYLNFKADMHKTYLAHIDKYGEKETTLDRIDNNKSYYKNNCRWATWRQQLNNTRRVQGNLVEEQDM